MELEKINYIDILNLGGSFLSLDISKCSLGWCMWYESSLKYGTKEFQGKSVTELKYEFRDFLINLVGDKELDCVYVEDTIMGNNYKTTKVLISLNTVPDDLMYEGKLKVGKLCRLGNTQWKKYLKVLTGYTPLIAGLDVKEQVQNMIAILGFCENVKQDVYDALGIALGEIARKHILNVNSMHKLKTDILKGYEIYQFDNEEEKANKIKSLLSRRKWLNNVVEIKDSDIERDLRYTFKKKVELNGDSNVFDIDISTKSVGSLLIKKHIDFDGKDKLMMVVVKRCK